MFLTLAPALTPPLLRADVPCLYVCGRCRPLLSCAPRGCRARAPVAVSARVSVPVPVAAARDVPGGGASRPLPVPRTSSLVPRLLTLPLVAGCSLPPCRGRAPCGPASDPTDPLAVVELMSTSSLWQPLLAA